VIAAAPAQAVPTTISFTGRLKTSAGVVNGNVNLTFKLYDAGTGGTAVWTETHTGVTADTGLVYVDLGSMTTLDSTILNGSQVFLEVTVGTETLSPRLPFNSVPYSVRAGEADDAAKLGGTITASQVITGITGTTGITATPSGNTVTVGLATTGCTTGQVYQYNGSTFGCANQTSYTAGSGIAISGTTISLSTAGCAANQVLQYNGTAFACANEAVTNYTGTAPIMVAGTTISLSTAGCTTGQVFKYNGAAFACAADANTTYTAGTGIFINGTTVSLATAGCAAGNAMKFDGTNWGCGVDANTVYSGTTPIVVAGTTISVMLCPANEILKMNSAGTAYGCAPDDNNTYTNGSGILLNSGVFSTDNTVVARKDAAAGNQSFDSGTLFLDYTNNRVGVNNAAPGTTLDVGGVARASDFVYAVPMTGEVFADPTLCTRGGTTDPTNFQMEVINPPNNAYGPSILDDAHVANTQYDFYCPVYIPVPPGAVVQVTNVTLAFYDGGGDCLIGAEFRTKPFGTSSFGTLISTVFDGASNADFAFLSPGGTPTTKAFPAFTPTTIASNTVSFVHAFTHYDATPTSIDCRYSGVLVDYTVSKP
jgi:hypothetical protein